METDRTERPGSATVTLGRLHEYDLIADWYVAERHGPIGVPETEALVAALPAGAAVLDVGCGPGLPLTKVLVDAGCNVTGLDSAPRMLEHFHRNFPDLPTICAAIQDCDLSGREFDAAMSWGMMFHLPHHDQRRAIANIASALKPGGLFLFTSADVDGSKQGEPMNGVPFHYYSFTVEGYRTLLNDHALTLEDVHKDHGNNCYYLARKRA